ncbi:MAG: hypothetical protein Q4F00_12655 [bacterium]|nr:hypothetical protein [bacterium]
MTNDYCPYCGSPEIVNYKAKSPDNAIQVLRCKNCSLMFTDLDRRFETSYMPKKKGSKLEPSAEEATLKSAWKLMYRTITDSNGNILGNLALERLFQHGYPLNHPLEFMVYRNICQIGSAFQHNHILGKCRNYSPVNDSGLLLDILYSNVQHLDYHLPLDEEKRLQTLSRLSEAMLLFTDIKIDRGLLTGQVQEFLSYSAQKRLEIQCAFADCLLTFQNGVHGLDYLKMAHKILKKCLIASGSGRLSYTSSKYYQQRPGSDASHGHYQLAPLITISIPQEVLAPLRKRIQEINATIQKIGSGTEAEWKKRRQKALGCFTAAVLLITVYTFFRDAIVHAILNSKIGYILFCCGLYTVTIGSLLILVYVFVGTVIPITLNEQKLKASKKLYKQLYQQ